MLCARQRKPRSGHPRFKEWSCLQSLQDKSPRTVSNCTERALTLCLILNLSFNKTKMATTTGTSANDKIYINPSQDPSVIAYGLDGDDIFYVRGSAWGGGSAPQLFGGNGSDTVSYIYFSQAVYVSLGGGGLYGLPPIISSQFNARPSYNSTSLENLTGSAYADFLGGDAGSNVLDGRAGNDTLRGERGQDTLIGGFGLDTFVFTGVSTGGGPITDSTIISPDVITDFVSGVDKIDISNFNGQLVGGALHASYTSVFRWAGRLASGSEIGRAHV